MAILMLCRFAGGGLILQGDGDPSGSADFSLYDVDGPEGSDPFRFGNATWEIVEGAPSAEYDADDPDSFWSAYQKIRESAEFRNEFSAEVQRELESRGIVSRAADVFGFVAAAWPSEDTIEQFADGFLETLAEAETDCD